MMVHSSSTRECDVMVVGGGTAGVVAAIQAARAGARTVLIEMTGQLGGTMTSAGVSNPGCFWSPHRQIIAGIGWELVKRCEALGGLVMPDFSKRNPVHPSHHIPLNRYVWALLAEEVCREAGVEIHYYVCPLSIAELDSHLWNVETFGKGVRQSFNVRELIDCTGDANVVAMLGLARVQDTERQPGTYMYVLTGYDSSALDEQKVQAAYEAALADGRLKPGDWSYPKRPFISLLRGRGENCQHLFHIDTDTARGMTDASLRGRESVLRTLRFVRTLPGCENAQIEKMAVQAGARDSWRIVGEKTVTYEDYKAAKVYEDAIAHTLYLIDLHKEDGILMERLPDELVPTIPMGALIPRGARRILAAGRIVSSDKLAHSALRVQASCMAMGQAVGAASALGAKRGIASRDVPIEDVRALLRSHGAIVPETTAPA